MLEGQNISAVARSRMKNLADVNNNIIIVYSLHALARQPRAGRWDRASNSCNAALGTRQNPLKVKMKIRNENSAHAACRLMPPMAHAHHGP